MWRRGGLFDGDSCAATGDAHAVFHPHVRSEAKPPVVPDGFGYGPRWQSRICDSRWQGSEFKAERVATQQNDLKTPRRLI
jgi:hypothetical protein